MDTIKFVNDIFALKPKEAFIVFVRSGINGKDELLKILFGSLRLPNYFGFNWDALSECLKDFSWIKEKEIYIIHDGFPFLDPVDADIYINILKEAAQDWIGDDEHKLFIVFPEQLEHQLALFF